MSRKQNFTKKYIDDTFKHIFFYECVVNLTREDIEHKKLSLENTTKEIGNTSKQNNISIDEEPVKKKQKLDTNGIDILKLEFKGEGTQFKSEVKSSIKPTNEIASTSTEEVPMVIDCDIDIQRMLKVNEAKPPVNGINHVKWNIIEIEKLHNKYFSDSVQVNIVTIANILNVISMSNEYLNARSDEFTKKRSEAEKIKHTHNACRLYEKYKIVIEKKLKNKIIDVTLSFKESEFYSAFIMFFLSIVTVLRVLDQTKFGHYLKYIKMVKQFLTKSLINNECNHHYIFLTFQSISFYFDCMNVLSVINDSRDTDPGVTNRMPLYFLKMENSLEYFKGVIDAVTNFSNVDLSTLIDHATFNCYNKLKLTSTVQHSNYNIPATETIQSLINSNETMQHLFLSKNQDGTYPHKPVVIANQSQVIGNTALEPSILTSQPMTSTLTPPTTACGTFQQKIQNKKPVANSYLHKGVCNTIEIDNKQYELIRDASGQLRAVFMPTIISNSHLVQVTAYSSDTTASTHTITTCQSVNGPSGQRRAVDNGTLISPPTVIIRCNGGHCNKSATITCICRKVNYCSHSCRAHHWYVHYTDCK